MKSNCIKKSFVGLGALLHVVFGAGGLLTTAVLLTGCANIAGPTVSKAKLSTIKTVGVISAAAYTLHLKDSTPPILSLSAPSVRDKFDVSDLHIDELVIQKAATLLSSSYIVKPVDYGGAKFLAAYDIDDPYTPNPNLGEVTSHLPGDGTVDAYLVLYPRYNPYLYTTGLTIDRESTLIRGTVYNIFGEYFIEVVDAHAHQTLARGSIFLHVNTDSSLWPENTGPTDAQKAHLKSLLEPELEPALKTALKDLRLVQ